MADSKCARWEKEAGESSECVAKLRTKVAELEIELAARNASLHGLKAKVAQQFMENDDINEHRRQFERDCKAQMAQVLYCIFFKKIKSGLPYVVYFIAYFKCFFFPFYWQ